MDNKNFYNTLARVYDSMIDFDAAIKRRIELLSGITGTCKTAADLGCGTGIDSIALSKLGLQTDAFDQSEEMIARAKLNASKYDANIKFTRSPIEVINFPNKYDLIVCLGNTIANLSEENLKALMQNCIRHLHKNGRLVIQLLNYYKLKDDQQIVIETNNEFYRVTRRYEKLDEECFFRIKIIDKKKGSENVLSTRIYPYKLEQIYDICKRLMISIKVYGDLRLNDFDKENSKDLVIIGENLTI